MPAIVERYTLSLQISISYYLVDADVYNLLLVNKPFNQIVRSIFHFHCINKRNGNSDWGRDCYFHHCYKNFPLLGSLAIDFSNSSYSVASTNSSSNSNSSGANPHANKNGLQFLIDSHIELFQKLTELKIVNYHDYHAISGHGTVTNTPIPLQLPIAYPVIAADATIPTTDTVTITNSQNAYSANSIVNISSNTNPLRNIRTIEFTNCICNSNIITNIVQLSNNIKQMKLSSVLLLTNDNLQQVLFSCKKLRSLTVEKCLQVKTIKFTIHMNNLTELSIIKCPNFNKLITNELKSSLQLRKACFTMTLITAQEIEKLLLFCPLIEKLIINNCNNIIQNLSINTNKLVYLEITNNNKLVQLSINCENLLHLLIEKNQILDSLLVISNELTELKLIMLTELVFLDTICPKLQYLDVRGCYLLASQSSRYKSTNSNSYGYIRNTNHNYHTTENTLLNNKKYGSRTHINCGGISFNRIGYRKQKKELFKVNYSTNNKLIADFNFNFFDKHQVENTGVDNGAKNHELDGFEKLFLNSSNTNSVHQDSNRFIKSNTSNYGDNVVMNYSPYAYRMSMSQSQSSKCLSDMDRVVANNRKISLDINQNYISWNSPTSSYNDSNGNIVNSKQGEKNFIAQNKLTNQFTVNDEIITNNSSKEGMSEQPFHSTMNYTISHEDTDDKNEKRMSDEKILDYNERRKFRSGSEGLLHTRYHNKKVNMTYETKSNGAGVSLPPPVVFISKLQEYCPLLDTDFFLEKCIAGSYLHSYKQVLLATKKERKNS